MSVNEWTAWWRGLGRTSRSFGGVYVVGVRALVVVAEATSSPWPFLLATVVTLPFGLAAFVGLYPAFAVARVMVTAVLRIDGAANDRWTKVVATPISMSVYALAALAALRTLDRVATARLRHPHAESSHPTR